MTQHDGKPTARRTAWRLLRVIAVCCLATAGPVFSKPYHVATRQDVAYGPLPEQLGDIYLPIGISGPMAAVLMIHGGGWISGSRTTVGKLGEILAARGVAVFNIDYRLAQADQPASRWPAQLVDAQLAVRFLRAHATEFGIDPTRIGAMGDSAGAHLALFLGELHDSIHGDEDGLYPAQPPDVAAVVDEFGPTDIPGMGADVAGNMKLLFGTEQPTVAEVDSASPLTFVTDQTAPIYILHGRADQVVPFQQSVRLDAVLQRHHVVHELVAFDGGHGYVDTPLPEVAKLQTAAFVWLLNQLNR